MQGEVGPPGSGVVWRDANGVTIKVAGTVEHAGAAKPFPDLLVVDFVSHVWPVDPTTGTYHEGPPITPIYHANTGCAGAAFVSIEDVLLGFVFTGRFGGTIGPAQAGAPAVSMATASIEAPDGSCTNVSDTSMKYTMAFVGDSGPVFAPPLEPVYVE